MRWSSHTIRQEQMDQRLVEGHINPRGIPVTSVPPRHRKVNAGNNWPNGKVTGKVEGTTTIRGDCTLDPIKLPQPTLAPDYSVRVGRINPDGTRTMATETTQQIADRRRDQFNQRETDLANHAGNLRRITRDIGIMDLPDTWGNRLDS